MKNIKILIKINLVSTRIIHDNIFTLFTFYFKTLFTLLLTIRLFAQNRLAFFLIFLLTVAVHYNFPTILDRLKVPLCTLHDISIQHLTRQDLTQHQHKRSYKTRPSKAEPYMTSPYKTEPYTTSVYKTLQD